MSAARERFKPDPDKRQAPCVDLFDRSGPPTAPTKIDNPHPNGCCKFQLANFGWFHGFSETWVTVATLTKVSFSSELERRRECLALNFQFARQIRIDAVEEFFL